MSSTNRYRVRVLTRDISSARSQSLAALPNVTLIQGWQDNQKDLHDAFKGVYGAWVNTDGFTLGQKNELFYGIRAYEIARDEKVQHYIWASTDYALKKSGCEYTSRFYLSEFSVCLKFLGSGSLLIFHCRG